MHMGANGFLWVRWGAGGARSTKTRQAGGIYGRAGQDWGAMAGEISPDMMFLGVWQKVVWMGADAYRAFWMGADGCGGKGGGTKHGKKSSKWARRGGFMTNVTVQKNRKVSVTNMVIRENQGEQ